MPAGSVEPAAAVALPGDEAELARLGCENERLREELRLLARDLSDANEQQAATAQVLQAISRSRSDLDSILQSLIETAVRLCRAEIGTITREQDGRYFRAAVVGFPEEFVPSMKALAIELDQSTISGRVLLSGSVEHIPDAVADPDYVWNDAQRASGFRTLLGLPMSLNGRPIGVLALGRREVRPFSDREVALLTSFADQAAIAVENSRLFDQLQTRTRQLQEALERQTATSEVLNVISRSPSQLQPVLDQITATSARLCDADFVFIFRLGQDGFYHYAASDRGQPAWVAFLRAMPIDPTGGSLTARVAREKRTIQITDAFADPGYRWPEWLALTGLHTLLTAPLMRDGIVKGVIAMARQEVQPFDQAHIDLITTFADQAVIAIENATLFEEVQAKTRELTHALAFQTATSEVLNVISRSPDDLAPVLNAIVETAGRICRADDAHIYLRVDGAYRMVACNNPDSAWVQLISQTPIEPAMRGSATARAIREGRMVHVPDTSADAERDHGLFARQVARTVLSVPLLRDGEALGAITLNRRRVEPFGQRECELVAHFADQAVIAISNVRLFEEVQARTQDLQRSLEDLRLAQDRLVQTEKLASLGQLTAGIAHEIKNPLNFVNNFASLSVELLDELAALLATAGLSAETREEADELVTLLKGNLDKVAHHGRRADSIVRNMLLHSRTGAGERRSVDVNALVEEAINLAFHGARAERQDFTVALRTELDPAAGHAELYPQEITRVLLNLAANGFYATARRRERGEPSYEPTLLTTTRDRGDRVEIRVRDNGTGIPDAARAKLFSPFFTTKPPGEGTGLGLSLSHDIVVKQHGGSLDVLTEPGAYTEFIITLPRRARTEAGEAP